MTPLEYYQQQIDSGLIQEDAQQYDAIKRLDTIYHGLIKQEKQQHKWFSFKKNTLVKGLYLWGSVGVGKTFLMDCFYSCVPVKKIRTHFHKFLQRIHDELKLVQGESDPLKLIAKKIASETQVLCFDEFFVSDIADAMILAGLFRALFQQGICLITSSNVRPDDLYKEGLQRERFLPAIKLIKRYTTELHMISHHDYRLTHVRQAGIYFTPLNATAEKSLETAFQHLSDGKDVYTDALELFGRTIQYRKRTDKIIWFDFIDLCDVPRSQKDYLALSRDYKIVFISNIPVIKPREHNLITAFINLIDVFYDAQTCVVISAAVDIEELYPEGQMTFEFARTQSRLIEMHSDDYFQRHCLNTELS